MDEPVYDEGIPHYERGPIIGRDGKFTLPVDADTLDIVCPTCGKDWPEAPDLALCVEDQLLWVDGAWLTVKRRIPLSILSVLVESFARIEKEAP